MPPDHARQSLARYHPQARAHHLYRAHQREREERSPQRGITESRTGDRVGRDSGGIVVRGPGDQTRPQATEEPPEMEGARPLALGRPRLALAALFRAARWQASGHGRAAVTTVPALDAFKRPASNSAAAAPHHVNDEHDQGHYQQQMDQASANAKAESEQPQNQHQSYNCPKHNCSPVSITDHIVYSEI